MVSLKQSNESENEETGQYTPFFFYGPVLRRKGGETMR